MNSSLSQPHSQLHDAHWERVLRNLEMVEVESLSTDELTQLFEHIGHVCVELMTSLLKEEVTPRQANKISTQTERLFGAIKMMSEDGGR